MKLVVISSKNIALNASVEISEYFEFNNGEHLIYKGLVFESRGGKKGTSHVRNSEYGIALKEILRRIIKLKKDVSFFLVSKPAINHWQNMDERALLIDGMPMINSSLYNSEDLFSKLSKAQKEKKIKPNTKGGNSTRRIMIVAEKVDECLWKNIARNQV